MEEISEKLLNKSKAFFYRAKELGIEDPLYPLLVSFSLEFMIRSTLAEVNPVLLVDFSRNEANAMAFFLGEEQRKIKTIQTNQIVSRLVYFVPSFTDKEAETVMAIFEERNIEVHSPEAGFTAYVVEQWLLEFYRIAFILLEFRKLPGKDFFGDYFEAISEEVSDKNTSTKKDVLDTISSFSKKYVSSELGRENLEIIIPQNNEMTIACPSCSQVGIISGKNISKSEPKISEDEVSETLEYLPTEFKCRYCGLQIEGYQKIKHIDGLSEIFKKTLRYDPAEYLNIDLDSMIQRMYPNFEPEPEYMDE